MNRRQCKEYSIRLHWRYQTIRTLNVCMFSWHKPRPPQHIKSKHCEWGNGWGRYTHARTPAHTHTHWIACFCYQISRSISRYEYEKVCSGGDFTFGYILSVRCHHIWITSIWMLFRLPISFPVEFSLSSQSMASVSWTLERARSHTLSSPVCLCPVQDICFTQIWMRDHVYLRE